MDTVYDRIQRNLLSDSELHSLLSDIKTKKTVTIIDACYSGGFIPQTSIIDILPDTYTGTNDTLPSSFRIFKEALTYYKNNFHTRAFKRHRGLVITASGKSEVACDGFFGQSVFTYFLLKTPLYADYNSDGLITAFEVYRFIYDSIEHYWNSEEKDKEWNFLPRISTQPYDIVLFDLGKKNQSYSIVSF